MFRCNYLLFPNTFKGFSKCCLFTYSYSCFVTAEAPVAGLDISETTDTDALVIDESSPIKYPTAAAFGSTGKQSLPVAGNEREDQHEAEANEGEYEEDEREEEEESNHSGELTVEENQQMTSDSATSQTPEVSKRSARLKMIEEATQEKVCRTVMFLKYC